MALPRGTVSIPSAIGHQSSAPTRFIFKARRKISDGAHFQKMMNILFSPDIWWGVAAVFLYARRLVSAIFLYASYTWGNSRCTSDLYPLCAKGFCKCAVLTKKMYVQVSNVTCLPIQSSRPAIGPSVRLSSRSMSSNLGWQPKTRLVTKKTVQNSLIIMWRVCSTRSYLLCILFSPS